MKRFIRILRWLILNGLFVYCAYLTLSGTGWHSNLLQFVVWLSLFCHLLCVLVEESKQKMRAQGRVMPAFAEGGVNIIIIGCLAASGHWATATAGFLSWVFEEVIYTPSEKVEAAP